MRKEVSVSRYRVILKCHLVSHLSFIHQIFLEKLICIRTVLESIKEIQPVHPKGDQSWVFIGRTDAEAETPRLWPPHAKS